jgi:hypothetical protein
MKSLVLIVLMLAAGSLAQEAVPAGTILPVQLNSTMKSNQARPGDVITARVMQDVPLTGHSKIRAGARVVGHVVAVQPGNGTGDQISLRFDNLVAGGRQIHITTNLRAMASMMDVSEAQVPESGPDRGTSEWNWTTDQIGGEVAMHGGGPVIHGSNVVGRAEGNGALVRVNARPGTPCRGAVEGNEEPQALWVFSSDACGLYDFPNLVLAHAGRTDPIGEITLTAQKDSVKIPAGSGMLLRVNRSTRTE